MPLRLLCCLILLMQAASGQAADAPQPEFDPLHAEKMQAGIELFKA